MKKNIKNNKWKFFLKKKQRKMENGWGWKWKVPKRGMPEITQESASIQQASSLTSIYQKKILEISKLNFQLTSWQFPSTWLQKDKIIATQIKPRQILYIWEWRIYSLTKKLLVFKQRIESKYKTSKSQNDQFQAVLESPNPHGTI